ncbi:transcription factor, partial [Maudiozyma exigua]
MPFNSMITDSSNGSNNDQNNIMINSQVPTITTTKPDDIHHNNSINNNNIIPNSNINMNTMNQLQPPHPDMRAPIIEIATYADTDVFECYIRGIESHIVMRKVKDDWVNLTQMFKIGNFSKNQRTKILEKES